MATAPLMFCLSLFYPNNCVVIIVNIKRFWTSFLTFFVPVAIGSNAIFSPSVDTSDFVMVSFIFPKTFFPRQSLTSRFGCDRLLNSVYLNKQPTFGSWDGRSAVDLLNGPLSRQNSVKALVSTWFLSVRVCVFAVPWGSELTRFTAPPSRYLGSAGDSKFTRWATLRSVLPTLSLFPTVNQGSCKQRHRAWKWHFASCHGT